jgi:hypothetical protein
VPLFAWEMICGDLPIFWRSPLSISSQLSFT